MEFPLFELIKNGNTSEVFQSSEGRTRKEQRSEGLKKMNGKSSTDMNYFSLSSS